MTFETKRKIGMGLSAVVMWGFIFAAVGLSKLGLSDEASVALPFGGMLTVVLLLARGGK